MSKLGYLDSIRGLACICVVLSHASLVFFPYIHAFFGDIPETNQTQNLIHNSPFTFVFSGTGAVYVFFVLSGFVLSRSMHNKDASGFISAIFARYPRLMIPALFSCIFAFLIYSVIVLLAPPQNLSPWFYNQLVNTPNFFDSIKSGVIDAFFLGKSNYNNVLWTMSIELSGSFLIYLFMYLNNHINKTISSALFLATIILIAPISTKYAGGFFCFWVGFTIYITDFKIRGFWLSLSALLLGLYLAGVHYGSYSYSWIDYLLKQRSYLACNIFAGILIVWSIYSSETFQQLLTKKWLIWLGKKSFSIYLLHMPLMILTSYLFFDLFDKQFGYDIAALLMTLSVVLLSVITSALFSFIDDYAVALSKLTGEKASRFYCALRANSPT
ncbi:acyltransferase [Pseudomonas fragi]|uniref:acyltransferase family protein n=1 Tax=Pseudomonas fragi TaxID=296 RepID=UPI0028E846D8|nr:acyltransferase [Pseudomonas fragi]